MPWPGGYQQQQACPRNRQRPQTAPSLPNIGLRLVPIRSGELCKDARPQRTREILSARRSRTTKRLDQPALTFQPLAAGVAPIGMSLRHTRPEAGRLGKKVPDHLIYSTPVHNTFTSHRLSGLFHKYGHVRCAQFGLRQGARARVYPLRYSTDRATPPQAKFGATLRAAVLFRPDFVARALQTAAGMLVARASSGRKTHGRGRNRIYENRPLRPCEVISTNALAHRPLADDATIPARDAAGLGH